MSDDSLGNRMKSFESVSDYRLMQKNPALLRNDGKSFHSWTNGLERPFDDNLRACMEYTAYRLCKEVEGARFAYTESDEISVLIVDYQDIKTQAWFNFRIQKMTSISASICTAAFATAALEYLPEQVKKKGIPKFDSRVFSLPKEEVTNYLIWRQQDSTRNSIQMIARSHFSQKQLHNKSCDEIQDMLFKEKGVNWNDTPVKYKRGVSLYKIEKEIPGTKQNNFLTIYRNKWFKDYEMPILTQNRNYVENWIEKNPVYPKVTNLPNFVECEDIQI